MDFRDVTLRSIEDFSEQLDTALGGLTQEQLLWRPAPAANHIAWIVWHLTRVEDGWINWHIDAGRDLWRADGWAERFGLPARDRWGVGDTPEQVDQFPSVGAELLTGYLAAVNESARRVIGALTDADLETTRQDRNPFRPRPAPTIAWVLSRIPVECAQHVGQVAYIRGLMAGQPGWREAT